MTNFLRKLPDKWMLLSIVKQHPNGISSFRLAEIATQSEATTGVVNETRNRMLDHERARRVSVVQTPTDKIYTWAEYV